MSVSYTTVQWNRHKHVYDVVLLCLVLVYMSVFMGVSKTTWTDEHAISGPILLIRAAGTCAFVMLHVVLAIGPLARLSTLFSPFLYNRRHFGVTLFAVAMLHGVLSLFYYHGFGAVDPLTSLLSGTGTATLGRFPFQQLGAAALVILFLMAATSHDFWLKNLSPSVWKALHMWVYVAYGLLVLHVALGALQAERSRAYPILLVSGACGLFVLHVAAGWRDRRRSIPSEAGAWVDAGPASAIEDGSAVTIHLDNGDAVAVFRHSGKLSAISNVCVHQGGPLGEGRIIDGCVTCPWHGYQYRPEDGRSPPPYTEKIPTYRLALDGSRVLLDPEPCAPGTAVDPVTVEEVPHGG